MMPRYLCLSVSFLDPAFHGRGNGDSLEWPPSPLRLYQALLASAKMRWPGDSFKNAAQPAFLWLEKLHDKNPPVIVAPPVTAGTPFRLSVPNNDLDVIARAWAKGHEPSKQPAALRTLKTVRPNHMPETDTTVRYLWAVPDTEWADAARPIEVLSLAAQSLVALGWGVDLVAGHGRVLSQEEADRLAGEWWRPTERGTVRLPARGTLAALEARHERFLHRVSADGGFIPVPPLTTFREVGYRRDTDPASRPFAAFQLLTVEADRMRAFRTRKVIAVAGMVRHAAKRAAEAAGWSAQRVASFILGHGDGPAGQLRGGAEAARFAYLPLPSIEERGQRGNVVGSVRRVLVVEPPGGAGEEAAWARRVLSGRELANEQTKAPEALLALIPSGDGRLRHYVGTAAAWSTVTPVVLPGHDDGEPAKAERLLRKAIVQAGFPVVLAQQAELEWRAVGFRPGLDLATRYDVPAYLKGQRYHVRIRWRDTAGNPLPVPGPLVLGAGRYCGLGLFAAEERT